jgi:hypothetical protein
MQEGKVLVIDGSQRIHRSRKGRRKERQALEGVGGVTVGAGAGAGVADNSGNSHGVLLGSLSPIPKLEQIVGEVVAAAAAAQVATQVAEGGRGAVGYDQGLVAASDVAPGLLRELHERVLEGL